MAIINPKRKKKTLRSGPEGEVADVMKTFCLFLDFLLLMLCVSGMKKNENQCLVSQPNSLSFSALLSLRDPCQSVSGESISP